MPERTARRQGRWPAIILGVMLVAALAPLPYGYYTLLRVVVFIAGLYLARQSWSDGHEGWAWIWGGMALTFNPLVPLTLGREIWMVVDAAGAAVCFYWVFAGPSEAPGSSG